MAEPRILDNGSLELVLAFAFHQKRLNEAKNRQIISKAITTITGQTIEIICTLDPDLKSQKRTASAPMAAPVPPESKGSESLSAISNIFGGGELLQS